MRRPPHRSFRIVIVVLVQLARVLASYTGPKHMLRRFGQPISTRSFGRSSLLRLPMSANTTPPPCVQQRTASTLLMEDDFSSEHLQDRIKLFLERHGDSCRLAVAIAGGGGHFLSTLSSTPGASRVLLEGTLTYDRESYRQYVQRDLDGANFRYCSRQSAAWASQSALQHAIGLAAAADPRYGHVPIANMTDATGLACASALQSPSSSYSFSQQQKQKDGQPQQQQRSSRAFCCVTRSDATMVELALQLARPGSRTRIEEDLVVSHAMLTCLEYALKGDPLANSDASPLESGPAAPAAAAAAIVLHETTHGDTYKLEWQPPAATARNFDVIEAAAVRILSGTDQVVLLVPRDDGCLQALAYTRLPPRSLIVPGSFHPPHNGHAQLARAALDATNCQVAWFELSLTNVDKPSLEGKDVVERIRGFESLSADQLPPRWGVLLTNAPMFRQKVDLLHPFKVPRTFGDEPIYFVIGTDTLVRLLDAKYYSNNSQDAMLDSLRSMPCHFCVGGRLQQKTDEPEFVTGAEQVEQLPLDLQAKFTILSDFRVDISSTELRHQRQQQQQQQEKSQAG